MTGDKASTWHERAEALRASHSARQVVEYSQLRLALGELWELLIDVPDAIRTAYRNLTEDELASLERIYRDELDDGRLAWTYLRNASADALSIGAQLRTLDAELSGRPGFKAAPSNDRSFLCEDVQAYIVPRQCPKPTDRRPGPGNGFGRRATPHHRILPKYIGEKEVQLTWSSHMSFGLLPGEKQFLGAALFPNMKVDFQKQTDGSHRAVSAPCANESELFAKQLLGAYAGAMLAVAWPELSMPPERLARLRGDMKKSSLTAPAAHGPAITVAGSWHEEEDGVIRNVMRVLDKSGTERLRFDKITTFVGGNVTEANKPGAIIPVLINNDALITFAVCSDFCDLEIPPPYLKLDVDLLVVPSLGNASALNGHEGNADRFRILFGTSTFLVQQNEDSRNPTGWVLPCCEDTKRIEENKPWSVRQISFI